LLKKLDKSSGIRGRKGENRYEGSQMQLAQGEGGVWGEPRITDYDGLEKNHTRFW